MNPMAVLLPSSVFAVCLIIVLCVRTSTGKGAKTANARLQRIQKVSGWVQGFTVVSFVGAGYTLLAFFMGWSWLSEPKVRIVISHSHIYTSPADMPDDIFYLWLVQIAWAVFGYWVVFSLFGLYRQGVLFVAKNVRHIRSLGYYLIVNWAINYQMQGTVRDMDLSTNSLFIGLLILFVSWIMDEGRKISEEQELTV